MKKKITSRNPKNVERRNGVGGWENCGRKCGAKGGKDLRKSLAGSG